LQQQRGGEDPRVNDPKKSEDDEIRELFRDDLDEEIYGPSDESDPNDDPLQRYLEYDGWSTSAGDADRARAGEATMAMVADAEGEGGSDILDFSSLSEEVPLTPSARRRFRELAKTLKSANLYVLGVPWGLKHFVGRVLAKHLMFGFFDLEEVVARGIEAEYAMGLNEYKKRYGLDRYLEQENKALNDLQRLYKQVIVTTEVTPTIPQNWRELQTGLVLWLDVDPSLSAESMRITAANCNPKDRGQYLARFGMFLNHPLLQESDPVKAIAARHDEVEPYCMEADVRVRISSPWNPYDGVVDVVDRMLHHIEENPPLWKQWMDQQGLKLSSEEERRQDVPLDTDLADLASLAADGKVAPPLDEHHPETDADADTEDNPERVLTDEEELELEYMLTLAKNEAFEFVPLPPPRGEQEKATSEAQTTMEVNFADTRPFTDADIIDDFTEESELEALLKDQKNKKDLISKGEYDPTWRRGETIPFDFPHLAGSGKFIRGKTDKYMWQQTYDQVSIYVPIDDSVNHFNRNLDVDLSVVRKNQLHSHMRLAVNNQTIIDDRVRVGVERDSWFWTIDYGPGKDLLSNAQKYVRVDIEKSSKGLDWRDIVLTQQEIDANRARLPVAAGGSMEDDHGQESEAAMVAANRSDLPVAQGPVKMTVELD